MSSPASHLQASSPSLPVISPKEPIYNALVEYIIEPLSQFQHKKSPYSSPKASNSKGQKKGSSTPNSPQSSPTKSAVSDSDPQEIQILSQAAEWVSKARSIQKTQPEMAYKLFARAGQTFCKFFRTRDAAQCYAMVIQIQGSLIQKKLEDLGYDSSELSLSMYDVANIFVEDESNPESSLSQIGFDFIKSLLVLFKARLYLARLMRPYNSKSAVALFKAAMECVVPRSDLNNLVPCIETDCPPSSPIQFSSMTQLLKCTLKACTSTLKKAIDFINQQRQQAPPGSPFISFASEILLTCQEIGGFFSEFEPSSYSVIVYEFSKQIALEYGFTEAFLLDSKRLAAVFQALKMEHHQMDQLSKLVKLNLSNNTIGTESLSDAISVLKIGIKIDDQVRLKKFLPTCQLLISKLEEEVEMVNLRSSASCIDQRPSSLSNSSSSILSSSTSSILDAPIRSTTESLRYQLEILVKLSSILITSDCKAFDNIKFEQAMGAKHQDTQLQSMISAVATRLYS